jgi:hypothetical protein
VGCGRAVGAGGVGRAVVSGRGAVCVGCGRAAGAFGRAGCAGCVWPGCTGCTWFGAPGRAGSLGLAAGAFGRAGVTPGLVAGGLGRPGSLGLAAGVGGRTAGVAGRMAGAGAAGRATGCSGRAPGCGRATAGAGRVAPCTPGFTTVGATLTRWTGRGRAAATIAGLPWLTLAYCWRFCMACVRCAICVGNGRRCCSRIALNSLCVGRTLRPPRPPL